jgi:hypothetical protein
MAVWTAQTTAARCPPDFGAQEVGQKQLEMVLFRRGYFFNSIALDTEPASIFQIDACVFLRFIEREEVASGNRITDARKKTVY